MSYVRTELAGVAYQQGLAMLAERPEEPNPYLDRALRNYKAAVSWMPGNAHAWRMLGELYLTLGQNDRAQEALARAVELRPEHPLYHLLLGDAYDGLGQASEAVREWRANRGGIWRRDEIAVNYLKMADAHIQMGDPLSAIPRLQKQALAIDPDNLFALATIVMTYDAAAGGRHAFADPYREAIEYVAPESLRLSYDERYTSFQARAARDLYLRGYWSREYVANVVRYWAWQGHPAATLVARSLHDLFPDDGGWRALLAEALAREGKLVEGLAVVEGNEEDLSDEELRVRAQISLAIAEVTGLEGDWEVAAEVLSSYAARAPDDWWTVAALAGMENPEEGEHPWREEYQAKREAIDREAAAALGLAAVDFGPNLVKNGDFSGWHTDSRPQNWAWSAMNTGDPWNKGLFVGGKEELLALEGESLRVQCLWVQTKEELEPSRAGFWQYDDGRKELRSINLAAEGQGYLISFDYCTQGVDDNQATLWLSYEGEPCWAGDRRFPATGGEWRHVAVVCHGSGAPLRPLLRSFGPGVVLFDNLEIREVLPAGS